MLRRQLPLILAVAWCAVLFGAASVVRGGGGPQPLDLTVHNGTGQWSQTIEKQSWWLESGTLDPNHTVINPIHRCTWDINDHGAVWSEGTFAAGAQVSTTSCHVWDFDPIYACRFGTCADWSWPSNWVGQVVTASGPVTVSVCFMPQDRCFTIVASSTRPWVYRSCIQVRYTPTDPAVVDVPDSGGGRGVVSDVTISLSNPGAKLKSVRLDWGISSDAYPAPGCGTYSNVVSDYPFRWVP